VTVHITSESPLTPEVTALFKQSDSYAAALYRAESNHMVDAESLAQPHVVFCVARQEEKIVACGAAVLYDNYAEIKRMFVDEQARGLGLGGRILDYLETEAVARGVRTLRLETGVHSYAAIGLYEKCGYRPISPFGDYWDDPLSVFYEKIV
jgi:putative acetyltransferase